MKTCSFNKCGYPQFGGGYCRNHQYLRTDRPVKGLSMSRRLIPSKKKESVLNTPKQDLKETWGFKSQKQLFDFVWDTRPHVCIFTGENLDKVAQSKRHWCFAHILQKGNYTYWKLNPDNIVLVYPDFHVCVDNFTEDMRDKHPNWDFDLWFANRESMKEKYRLFLKDNML